MHSKTALISERSSVGAALEIVADHWSILLIRECFIGTRSWGDLELALSIPPATLSRRLTLLIDSKCLIKNSKPGRGQSSYALTAQGEDLFPFLMAAREWQLTWDAMPGRIASFWRHSCGASLRCIEICESCGDQLKPSSVRLDDQDRALAASSATRYRQSSGGKITDRHRKVVDFLGDSRAVLIMAALLRGHHKFDDIQRYTGLPPATVSNRLRKVQLLGLAHTRLYQENPSRVLYEPSRAGRDLFSVALQLFCWSNKWLDDQTVASTPAVHIKCNQSLKNSLCCQDCRQPVTFHSCEFIEMAAVGAHPAN